jgi:hypothetical protein
MQSTIVRFGRILPLIAVSSALVCSVPVRASQETPDGVTTNAQVHDANAPHLRVIVRDSYLPGMPVLVRVEIAGPNDVVNRDVWDANAVLSVSENPAVSLSPNRLALYNGLGSALVTFAGKGDFALTARVAQPPSAGKSDQSPPGAGVTQTLEKTVTLTDWSDQPVHTVPGMLRQSQTWSGVYHLTSDLTIPTGVTLTLDPGTLVLLDGVASGTNGADIDVRGSIQALGTAASPVTFTAYATGRNWGELHFTNAQPSLFRYTEIVRAGRSPGTGHTGTGPALRVSNSALTFDHASLTDNAGKIMEADGGTALNFRSTLFTRSVMGPEISNTSLLFENGWIIDMRNKDDADGIYIHDQGANRVCTLTGSVIAGTDDDGIDTLGSDILVQDCIIRNCKDKGISVYAGEVTIYHCLLVANNLAPEDPTVASIAAKAFEGPTATAVVNIDHTTIVASRSPGRIDAGIQSHNKYGVKTGRIFYNVTNSIVDATQPVSVQAPYLSSDIHVSRSDLVGMTWPGLGNLSVDAQFLDPQHSDYRLSDASPCLGKASPDSLLRDIGYYQGASK